MIFIINKTGQQMQLQVKKYQDKPFTDLAIVIPDYSDCTLFRTESPIVTEAFHQRFPAGVTNLPLEVNRHFFLASNTRIVTQIPEDLNNPIVMLTEKDPEKVRTYPKNIIIVVSAIKDEVATTMDDDRNVELSYVIEAGDYAYTIVIPKWANWGGLKYRAVIKSGGTLYELTASTPEGHKYPQNELVALTEEEAEAYYAYKKDLQAKYEARGEEIAERRRAQSKKDNKPGYNNHRDNNGGKRPYQKKDGRFSNTVGSAMPQNNRQKKPYTNTNNKRGGHR